MVKWREKGIPLTCRIIMIGVFSIFLLGVNKQEIHFRKGESPPYASDGQRSNPHPPRVHDTLLLPFFLFLCFRFFLGDLLPLFFAQKTISRRKKRSFYKHLLVYCLRIFHADVGYVYDTVEVTNLVEEQGDLMVPSTYGHLDRNLSV